MLGIAVTFTTAVAASSSFFLHCTFHAHALVFTFASAFAFAVSLPPIRVRLNPLGAARGVYEQIFNDLDVQDDKLMLDLAVFLNRLVRLGECGKF